jgi:hypothetical protein
MDDPVAVESAGQERAMSYTTSKTKRGSLKDRVKKIDQEGAKGELDSYHSGGKVRKTGPARLKKGETVITKTQMKEIKRKGKKRGKKRGGKKR